MVEKLDMALPMFSVICTARYVQRNKRREREREGCVQADVWSGLWTKHNPSFIISRMFAGFVERVLRH